MELITFETNLEEPQTTLPIVRDLNLHLNDAIYIGSDLHGSFIKLLSVLIHFNFITYADEPMRSHYTIVQQFYIFQQCAYDHNGKTIFPDTVYDFLNQNFYINTMQFKNKKLIFLGDTLCDRGPSDFMTLLIFDWMAQQGIEYSGLLGNHEFIICIDHLLSDESHVNPENSLVRRNLCYYSFDYYKLNPQCKRLFRLSFLNYLKKLTLFKKISTSTQILLTHAPCTKENFDTLSELSFDHKDIAFDSFVTELFIKGTQGKLNALQPDEHKSLHIMYDFCSNRKTLTPFFHSQHEGINIFGHMSGVLRSSKNHQTHFSSTQLCIDRCTGMPNMRSGEVAYVIL